MPNIERVNTVIVTSIDKINRIAATSIQSVDGQDLVTFEPAIYSTVTGNLSAGTFNIPPGAAYVSVIAVGAGGGTQIRHPILMRLINSLPQGQEALVLHIPVPCLLLI